VKLILILALCVAVAVAVWAAQSRWLRPRERAAVSRYLGCIECDRGELDSVRALAHRKPGATVRALADVLLNGLDQGQRDALTARLRRMWARDSVALAPQDSFVAFYSTSYDVAYRKSAAIALGWINTPGADSVLRVALAAGLHPRVRRVVSLALADSLPLPP
jgi:hypothetical protein